MELLHKGVLFDKTPRRIRQEITRKYLAVLKTASYLDGGRRLLLKNPVNTARIPMLLDLFPDAKFVVIHRSPYEVYPSSVNLHRKILAMTSLQDFDDQLIEDNVLAIYEQVMQTYLKDRSLIPPQNLVEVGYADLDERPAETVRDIYRTLDIDGWDEASNHVDEYIESQRGYRKNGFAISDRSRALIEDRWRFAFDAFGYAKRADGSLDLLGTDHADHSVRSQLVDLAG